MILVSERLKAIARCAGACHTLADVGTDHAYLPIYVRTQGMADRVIAMDVRKKPLERAAANIKDAACDNIELRLSDGLFGLSPGEAQTVTISGMGGKLMERILVDGRNALNSSTRLCLSPQSELMHFRYFLEKNGFVTLDELMLSEDGKTYVIMAGNFENPQDLHPVGEPVTCSDVTEASRLDYVYLKYGKLLIQNGSRELFAYLELEGKNLTRIIEELRASCAGDDLKAAGAVDALRKAGDVNVLKNDTGGIRARLFELEAEKSLNLYAMELLQSYASWMH